MTDMHDVTRAVDDLHRELSEWWEMPPERRDARFNDLVEQIRTTRDALDGFLT